MVMGIIFVLHLLSLSFNAVGIFLELFKPVPKKAFNLCCHSKKPGDLNMNIWKEGSGTIFESIILYIMD